MWMLTKNKRWEDLKQQFDWVVDMHGVPQDKVHHAEGDVAVHTEMVLNSLDDLKEFRSLTEQDRALLWAAALLHDVEKRSTTVLEEDGSITSKGHARKGAMTARRLLYKYYDAPFRIREHVVNLVRYHGLPLWAIEKPAPTRSVVEASMVLDTRMLAMLATADALGRICADKDDLLYRIELFSMLCKENECWGNTRSFDTAGAKFEFFNKEDGYIGHVPYEDYGSRVFMMSGLPGAGKDTYVLRNYKELDVISLDDIRRELKIEPTDKRGNGRVIQHAKELARTFLRSKKDFVWNATNITATMRSQMVDLFITYKAYVTIVYIEVPYKQLTGQNKNREHIVPQVVLDRLVDKLEVPMPWEAHEVIYHVDE